MWVGQDKNNIKSTLYIMGNLDYFILQDLNIVSNVEQKYHGDIELGEWGGCLTFNVDKYEIFTEGTQLKRSNSVYPEFTGSFTKNEIILNKGVRTGALNFTRKGVIPLKRLSVYNIEQQ